MDRASVGPWRDLWVPHLQSFPYQTPLGPEDSIGGHCKVTDVIIPSMSLKAHQGPCHGRTPSVLQPSLDRQAGHCSSLGWGLQEGTLLRASGSKRRHC